MEGPSWGWSFASGMALTGVPLRPDSTPPRQWEAGASGAEWHSPGQGLRWQELYCPGAWEASGGRNNTPLGLPWQWKKVVTWFLCLGLNQSSGIPASQWPRASPKHRSSLSKTLRALGFE